MKQAAFVSVFRKFRIIFISGIFLVQILSSCSPGSDQLGVDIFPASDTILVYTDTITNLETRIVRSRPWVTSITQNEDAGRIYLLGNRSDTMTGSTTAEIVTEFGLAQIENLGSTPEVDSITLYLYVSDVIGDTAVDMHLIVHEFNGSLSLDDSSKYYSDYDITDKYITEPIVDEVINVKPGVRYDFLIENESWHDRIVNSDPEDSVFNYNDRLQNLFPGLYIKAEALSENGAFAEIPIASSLSGVKFKYMHDTLSPKAKDSLGYSTYSMSFNNYYAQKVNIFSHDFSGTALESIVDNPDAEPGICYIQGLSGANMKVRLPDIKSELGLDPDDNIALNAANLLFYVVPDSISGIAEEDYPDKLMLDAEAGNGVYATVFDYVTTTNDFYYGKLTRSNEQSAFFEPVYFYKFHLGRHLQSIMQNDIENNDLIIYPDDPETNDKIIKVWSNYSGQPGGLRLELIYTKF